MTRMGGIVVCMGLLLGLLGGTTEAREHQFTFAWPHAESDAMRPRGGTTSGPEVILDTRPSAAWQALQAPDISLIERDRRAIRAMAGPYRTSFDFLETVGFVSAFQPDRPYQSWSTEYVYLVADESDFISLQHIIVMFFADGEGQISGPMVVKHWRQDWRYQDRDMHVYVGHNTWEHRRLSKRKVKGTWSQAVYQVDDSPRYESFGRWHHQGNYSSWQSGRTWRPLPRREFSVRDDYHVLVGTNRHTITPSGWIHEEDNLKLVLREDGQPQHENPYLAGEIGLNRYERIIEHDFSAGDVYWHATGPFWADVRQAWADVYRRHGRFSLAPQHDGQPLYANMFGYASGLAADADYDSAAARAFIERTLANYLR